MKLQENVGLTTPAAPIRSALRPLLQEGIMTDLLFLPFIAKHHLTASDRAYSSTALIQEGQRGIEISVTLVSRWIAGATLTAIPFSSYWLRKIAF